MLTTHPFELIGSVIDRPRKTYVEYLRNRIVRDCDHSLKLLSRFQRQHGNTLNSGHIVRSVNDIRQLFIIIRQKAQRTTSLSAVREVRSHLHEMDMIVDALVEVHAADRN